jgi:hypothetical protein
MLTKEKSIPQVFIGCGDLHAEKNTPTYRIDNYWETWQRKMLWIIDYANKKNARLLVAGDIFNTSRVGPDVTNIVLAIFQEASKVPYVVPGQHDLKYHTDLEKCPLYTLELAGAVKIIEGRDGMFTGAGFGDDIPDKKSKFLITHTTITEGEPPFFLEDAIAAKKFMRMHPQFQIIVSGDYHVPFHVNMGDRHLINTGTIIRNKKDMHAYIPYIWEIVLDEEIIIDQIEIPHEPYNDVFDIESIEYDNDHGITIDTTKMKELIDSGIEADELDTVVWTLYKQLKEDGVKLNKALVEEVLEECL